MSYRVITASLAAALTFFASTGLALASPQQPHTNPGHPSLSVATYNTSLNRPKAGQLIEDLRAGDQQAKNIAAVIQHNNPDVILLNEFDYDDQHEGLELFKHNYLEVSQRGQQPVTYQYSFTAPVNTGVQSGFDLNGNGKLGDPDDAWGFGMHPGQYGMVVLSKKPIKTQDIRTFQNLKWADMPDNHMPRDYYDQVAPGAADQLRLSSKSHWDVPIEAGGKPIHLLVSHPTPPAFDGPEKRNAKRNQDEIRVFADYISGGHRAKWLVDDQGRHGGLGQGQDFVFLGDQNSDPQDGDNHGETGMGQVLGLDRVCDTLPTSDGAVWAAAHQPGNETHLNPPQYDTGDFSDPKPGNLRTDYVLPSCSFHASDAHVFWPAPGEEFSDIMNDKDTSDHHLVKVTLQRR